MYKLLIVDDEPLTRHYFKTNIQLLHAEWVCESEAGDGEEALALLDQGERYDLIITDIKMPVMTGLELARALAARPVRPHLVILSGYDEFALAKEAMQYGVQDYLLKPMVNEEISAVLSRVAEQLASERSEEAAQRMLLSLSNESREQVARNFLRAVISDNSMEIKVLYPMLHRLKIQLLEAEGAILIVDLDECQLIERDISMSHLALYRYIVHQTASELTASASGMLPFIDDEQRTVFFVAGDDPADVQDRCKRLYTDLSAAILDMTKLRLWGAYGSPEMDVLQLNLSYRRACAAMKHRLFLEPDDTAVLCMEDARLDEKGQRLDREIATLHAARAEAHDRQLQLALQAIVRELEPLDRRKLLLLGAYMVKSLKNDVPEESRAERTAAALQLLRREPMPKSAVYETSKAVGLYRSLLDGLYAQPHPAEPSEKQEASEHEIVTRVKAYILENFNEPLSLAHIADRMGLSYSYLSSLFHQNTQESYIKFLTRVRMEHAADLLRQQPAEKVYDVAERVGYLSVKHFSYVFKQHFGIPPGQYQEKALR